MRDRAALVAGSLLVIGSFVVLAATSAGVWDGELVQYGSMHEAIGQRQDEGRVQIRTLLEQPHFFGVAALEKLGGEITILDGRPTLTRVDGKSLSSADESTALDSRATLLVGAYVPSWVERKVASDVGADEFDSFVADAAVAAGIELAEPYPFVLEGTFRNLRLHVINGACPMHARLRKLELPRGQRPFEANYDSIGGTIVGIYAKDAVGAITHPATSTHLHLLFKDPRSGKLVTGHVEQAGVLQGAVLRLPKTS